MMNLSKYVIKQITVLNETAKQAFAKMINEIQRPEETRRLATLPSSFKVISSYIDESKVLLNNKELEQHKQISFVIKNLGKSFSNYMGDFVKMIKTGVPSDEFNDAVNNLKKDTRQTETLIKIFKNLVIDLFVNELDQFSTENRNQICDALSRTTGKVFLFGGRNPKKWKIWWEKNKILSFDSENSSNCIKCGKLIELNLPNETNKNQDPFLEAVNKATKLLSTPDYTCVDCGAIVCKGCLSLGSAEFNCPGCDSENIRYWSD